MTTEAWRWVLLAATIIGAAITIWGLVAAYLGARREYREADERLKMMPILGERERVDTAEIEERYKADVPREPEARAQHESRRAAERDARRVFWEAEYARHDLTRPTYGNMVELAAMEAKRLLGLVLNSTRRDFLVAGFGLVVSTLASAGSLYLAT